MRRVDQIRRELDGALRSARGRSPFLSYASVTLFVFRRMLRLCVLTSARPGDEHGGVVDTKVKYFGVKSTKVPRGQMGTKPAKVAHSPSWPTKAAKPGLFPVIFFYF